MRVDMYIGYLIDDISYAKRTLTLQKAFNQIESIADSSYLDKHKRF